MKTLQLETTAPGVGRAYSRPETKNCPLEDEVLSDWGKGRAQATRGYCHIAPHGFAERDRDALYQVID